MTVSTSGLPAGIRRLARAAPKVRLALSIGSAQHHVRKSLMPIANSHPFDDVMDAAMEHATLTTYAPLWALTLLSGFNDSEADAHALAQMVHRFHEQTGVRPRVSIIPYNRIADDADDPFRRCSDEREDAFRKTMAGDGVFTHKRYSGGGDVGAACGQLAAQSQQAC